MARVLYCHFIEPVRQSDSQVKLCSQSSRETIIQSVSQLDRQTDCQVNRQPCSQSSRQTIMLSVSQSNRYQDMQTVSQLSRQSIILSASQSNRYLDIQTVSQLSRQSDSQLSRQIVRVSQTDSQTDSQKTIHAVSWPVSLAPAYKSFLVCLI